MARNTDAEIKILVLLSRTIGGLRAGDLNAPQLHGDGKLSLSRHLVVSGVRHAGREHKR